MRIGFLFDTTGYAAEPFTKSGHETYIIDILNKGARAFNPRATHVLDWNILEREQDLINLKFDLLFGFPPCTDLAVSGAKHFSSKAIQDPLFQEKAIHLARSVERIGDAIGCPWIFENPKSVLLTKYRNSDHMIHPCWYGGYLPEDDFHPDFSKYIAPRDSYTKETHFWKGNGMPFPLPKYVKAEPGWNRQTRLLGGKSFKTKLIRSASPRGLFTAFAELYKDCI